MTDVTLTHTADGAEIAVSNGIIAMDDGLSTAVYISLFGGASDDSGLAVDDSKQWWGNYASPDSAEVIRSETGNLLAKLPATSSNLKRIQDAIGRDLEWMTTSLGAAIDVTATIPRVGWIAIAGTIEIDGRKFPVDISKPWTGQ